MKILITGICGFVGSALARAWLDSTSDLTIYGMDNLVRPGSESNRIPLQKLGVRFFHGDIRLASDLEALPQMDWVIDAAANPSVLAGIDGRSSRLLVEHNLLGTINILEYCKHHNAGLILLSTSRVYSITMLSSLHVEINNNAFRLISGQSLPQGLSAAGVSEVFSTDPPVSLYGGTKRASEALALEYGEAFGFPVWIDRCGVLAGAGQFGTPGQGIFSYWINAWLRRRQLTYFGFGGRGCQVRDCFHPHDLASLLRKQISTDGRGKPRTINLGGGRDNAMSLAQLSSWCADRFGARDVAGSKESRRFDVPWLVMDSSLARETWDWRPQTQIPDILEEIARHAEQNPDWLELSGHL